jgi:hypothetical protein
MKCSLTRIFVLTLLVIGISLAVSAQEQATQGQQNQDQEATQESLTAAPAAMQGEMPVLLGVEAEQKNRIEGGMAVRSVYDDNFAGGSSPRFGDFEYSFLPSIGLDWFQPHTDWTLQYDGGYTMDQRSATRDDATNQVAADVQHKFSPRLSLELRENYMQTSDPFVSPGVTDGLASLIGPGQLNPLATTPIARRESTVSFADIGYQLSRHSSIGASGNFSSMRFGDVAGTSSGSGLIDTTESTGRLFYAWQISRMQTIGAQYQLEDMEFAHAVAHTLDHSIYLFDDLRLTQHMSLSLFAGPEYSHVHDQVALIPGLASFTIPVFTSELSYTAGATYTWQGLHNGVNFMALRSVTDGGGLLGAVRNNSGDLSYQHAFSPRFRMTLNGGYSDGRLIGGAISGPTRHLTYETAGIGFERKLYRNFSVEADYTRTQQPHAGIVRINQLVDHNRAAITFRYRFAKELNR